MVFRPPRSTTPAPLRLNANKIYKALALWFNKTLLCPFALALKLRHGGISYDLLVWMSAGGSFGCHGYSQYLGRKIYLGNINAAEMEGITKSLSAVSWDAFSVQLLVSALTLFYVANNPDAVLIAVPIIIMSFLGAGLSGLCKRP